VISRGVHRSADTKLQAFTGIRCAPAGSPATRDVRQQRCRGANAVASAGRQCFRRSAESTRPCRDGSCTTGATCMNGGGRPDRKAVVATAELRRNPVLGPQSHGMDRMRRNFRNQVTVTDISVAARDREPDPGTRFRRRERHGRRADTPGNLPVADRPGSKDQMIMALSGRGRPSAARHISR